MMTQDNATKLIMALIAICLLATVQNICNTKRFHRCRQFLIPILSLFYIAIAIALVSVNHEKLFALWDDNVASRWPIMADATILASNLTLMLVFLLIKAILVPLVSSQCKNQELLELIVGDFYEYDDLYSEWFLQKRWANFRHIVKGFAIAAAAVSVGLLVATWIGGSAAGTWIFAFPCAFLVVVNEIFNFVNGQTKEEFVHSVLGEEEDVRRVGNFYRIREIFEKLFAPQVLASHTGCEFSNRQGANDLLDRLSVSTDPVERSVAQYFGAYDERTAFEPDGIQATVSLVKGGTVVFFNPFYRDNTPYFILPILNSLLRGRRVLVVAGRDSTSRDAVCWATDFLKDYTKLRSMWRIAKLDAGKPECEVGVLSFRQLYDTDVLSANRDFFGEVDFVLLLEPSVMAGTGQVGLSILSSEMHQYGIRPTYCICDRYSDGLVDTMSHLLHTEITNVVAQPVPRCVYTGMAWNADGDYIRQKLFDKQTKFLGNGLELAATAIKNQVPQVAWVGETKVPLRDLKWIVGLHYATICRYMNLPIQQKSLYERVKFVPSLWSAPSTREEFIIVEDEICNMFGMMRIFLSKGSDQLFVNVLSENYLLRDYMRCNQQMFLSNPNAIPSFTPDYAKTERNTLMKLVILMSVRPVSEQEVADELKLAGCVVDDAYTTLCKLLGKYTYVDSSVFDVKNEKDRSDAFSLHTITYFSISKAAFRAYFASSLKTAYYIVEDEKCETEFVDAKLFGHVTQTILPGQFVVYDGKYYEVHTISPENGIVLRRASNLYTGRRYYRQIRAYHLDSGTKPELIYSRKFMGLEISFVSCDFSVTTTGYLDLGDNHDLRMAKLLDFEDDPLRHNYDRRYRNKEMLCIRLPDSDEKLRFTFCLLLSEMFRTIFPDVWQYLAVTVHFAENIKGILNYAVYSFDGCLHDDEIYILEDSDLDLGLLDTINRNLPQILEILADYLTWHFEKMREPEAKDPLPVQAKVSAAETKRRNLFLRMAESIRRLFPKKEQDVSVSSVEIAETPANVVDQRGSADTATTEAPDVPEAAYSLDAEEKLNKELVATLARDDNGAVKVSLDFENKVTEGPKTQNLPGDDSGSNQEQEKLAEDELEPDSDGDGELTCSDGTDIFEEAGVPEDDLWLEDSFKAIGITPLSRTRYQQECYMKYGFDEIDERLKIEELYQYLRVRGCCNNSLTKARKCDTVEMGRLDFKSGKTCDFCEIPLSGVSYERLNDGRIRCNNCAASAVTSIDEFREIFHRVLEMLELFYSINIHVPIAVKVADMRTIAKGVGSVYRPATQAKSRVLGFAQRKKGNYSIFLENGSPRLASIITMVHELTHIWQYVNWNEGQVEEICKMPNSACTARAADILYEGMAEWASIQYLYQIGETFFAAQQEALALARNDIYGIGLRLFDEQYPLVKDMSLIKHTPFASFPPVEPENLRKASKSLCTVEECEC